MEEISILEKIKSGPYWRVNIRPYEFEEEKIERLAEIWELVARCQVSLRGWQFPYIDNQNKSNGQDYVQSECNFNGINEFWRFYKSGQFIHYFSVYEDFYVKSKKIDPSSMWKRGSSEKPSGYLGILTTIYRMTEIYEFAMRVAQHGIYDKGVTIFITLSGIKKFELSYLEPEKVLLGSYISKHNEIKLKSQISKEELFAKGHEEAIKKCIEVFERFNWLNCPKRIFLEDQKKFLERRM